MRVFLLLCCPLGALLLAGLAPTAPPRPGQEFAAYPELVVFGRQGAERIAVRIEIDGQPLASLRDAALDQLFRFLDRDDDGELSRAELVHAPAPDRLRQLDWGYFFTHGGGLDLEENTVSREAFHAHYRQRGFGTLLVSAGRSPVNASLDRALLRHLDVNGDGLISEAEWKQAERSLLRRDLDEDDLVSVDELSDRLSYPSTAGGKLLLPPAPNDGPDPLRDSLPLLPLPPSLGDTHWRTTLATRGGPRLEARWRQDARASAWTVRLGKVAPGLSALEWHPGRETVKLGRDESLTVRLAEVPVLLGCSEGDLPRLTGSARAVGRLRFRDADVNRDGVVDRAEAGRSSFSPLASLHAIADGNADGKLTLEEWTAWMEVQEALALPCVRLSVIDLGQGLFTFLDANHDGALSVRELRTCWKRLTDSDCVSQGRVDPQRLPRLLALTISRGRSPTLLPVGQPGLPQWFRNMDSNRDGDVSRKEFLGSPRQFQRFDQDGDGLIGSEEARRGLDRGP